MLLNRRSGLVRTRDFNRDGVLQIATGQAFDLRRKRRREQQRRALLRQMAQNALQIWQEADIKHAVCFVQDHIFNLVEHHILGFNMV